MFFDERVSRVHGMKRNFALANLSAWKTPPDSLTVTLLSLSRTVSEPLLYLLLNQHLHQALFPIMLESFSQLLSLSNIMLHIHLFYLSGTVDFVLLYGCILSIFIWPSTYVGAQ